MSILSVFRQSLFVRVAVVLLVTAFAVGLLIQFILQSTLLFRVFPGALEPNAKSVAELVYLVEQTADDRDTILLSAYSGPARNAVIRDAFPDGARASEVLGKSFDAAVSDLSGADRPREIRFRTLRFAEMSEAQSDMAGAQIFSVSGLEVSVELEDGKVLSVLYSVMAIMSSRGIWLAILLLSILLSAIIVALRTIFRPLRDLETAALNLGSTSRVDEIEEQGTEDIRRVARALNASQARVKKLLTERSQMLASLAHDIRTGLTHLKLRLDKIDAETRAAFNDDIQTMEHLISDMLLYARAEQPSESFELVELNAFLRTTISALPYDVPSQICDEPFWIAADQRSLKRAVTNLIDNATRYADGAFLRTQIEEGGLLIHIEDDGPGIAEDDLETLFDPFYRVESSRNRETGGSGLGLTIARALLSAHGATLVLENKKPRGLRATALFSVDCRVE
ncbi:MAG: ATP-binding protein [Pseudomonadota bacterium]